MALELTIFFFADDAFLFVRKKQSKVEEFVKMLTAFERMYGQSINLEKSMVYFSPTNPASQRANLSNLLKMRVVTNLDGYLGLPISIGKRKFATFKSILDRTTMKINSWSKKLLSYEGKEIFIKSILQFIPIYAFSVFFIPNYVLKELQSLIGRVWWKEKTRIESITKAARILYEGFGWNVKRGSRISIWSDKWGFEGLSGDLICLNRREVQEEKACDLLNKEKNGWNEKSVYEIYGDNMGDQIYKIPILHNSPNDSRI
ncbi:hypothetical protein J1N35_002639 [Gossypium stocksii]|uniref:Reverse transcriptase domain-containing protein n=1 Tax=Gossypium stocksii TaxID=47602 RepID=A0A9D3WM48_9ROSI|nr:hypothetical protein J1N35_002639 [Gossypium stocksii]